VQLVNVEEEIASIVPVPKLLIAPPSYAEQLVKVEEEMEEIVPAAELWITPP
jgi:hypothetical protein